MSESLRGVFYIVRGGHRKDKKPQFFNEVSETYNFIGGYDPEDQTNPEWYMLMDNVLFMCQAASSDINTVLQAAERCIMKYKTKERYIEVMKSLDAYHQQSPIMRRLEQEVYHQYGDYFRPELEEVEDRAYTYLKDNTPVMKARRRFKSRLVTTPTQVETPKAETPPPSAPATPVRKTGAKLIRKRHII